MTGSKYTMIVHGGAGRIPREMDAERKKHAVEGLRASLQAGYDVLRGGGSATEAVVAAIMVMEDSPWFNAGRGATFNRQGYHEMDASIMRGEDRACGAVAGCREIRNPILFCKTVMEKDDHILYNGTNADNRARDYGLATESPDYFYTELRYRGWQRALEKQRVALDHTSEAETDQTKDTVGAVALDSRGHLAAGTSTGGMNNKIPGRVGDSALIGIGTWACDQTCAVSTTGWGETFIRDVTAYDIHARMELINMGLQDAVHQALFQRLPAETGGIAAMDRHGNPVLMYNSVGMYRGLADADGRFEVLIWEEREI